ncbi:MAG: 30S ribosomal protein S17 [Candidatus Margulisiibacteriota bacterium]
MERNQRKVKEGKVVAISGDKTVRVRIERRVRDTRYHKIVKRHKNILVHDEKNSAKVGDLVRVMETRPLSKLKVWRIVDVKENYFEEADNISRLNQDPGVEL